MKNHYFNTLIAFCALILSSCQKDNNQAPPIPTNKNSATLNSTSVLCSTPAMPSLNKGLVGYYPFLGNANDLSGYNNNGVLNDFPPTTGLPVLTSDKMGRPNSAYIFNGTSNYIEARNPLFIGVDTTSVIKGLKEFSIYMRYKSNTSGTLAYYADNFINISKLSINPNHSVTFSWGWFNDNLVPKSYGASVTGGPVCLDPNKWTDVVVNFKNGCLILYLNGKLVGFTRTGFSEGSITGTLVLGAKFRKGSLDFFTGIIDDVRLYNRSLTNGEIHYLLNH